ncbi:MAG: endo-1,4-beta-xylanase [Anaerolineae bacterium]|nr:endo-1,4-beta-xylanase [Anaerolineae bacterium]
MNATNPYAHRTAQATVTVRKPDGAPLAHQDVTVEQRAHKFLFGGTAWEMLGLVGGRFTGADREKAERIRDGFMELFNVTSLPFYWGGFEPRRGQPHTAALRAGAQWFVDHGCVVKGHTLCWHTVTAPWLMELSNDEIFETQVARIRRDVGDFAGLIDMWDVVNEGVIMPIFDKYDNGITRICKERGRIATIRAMFEAARETNPGATLLLNDFDVSPAYDILVEGCLEAGIRIDVIGIQSHMHQGYWGVEKTLRVLEAFERFGLPIHFTENTLVSGEIMPEYIVDLNDYKVAEWPSTPDGEARQAEEVATHYKTLFAHPLVESITWWGLTDGGWLKAPSGLLTQAGIPKPAYHTLRNLIKGEWWLPPTKMTTDGEGKVQFTGYLGDYAIICDKKAAEFKLENKGETVTEVMLP